MHESSTLIRIKAHLVEAGNIYEMPSKVKAQRILFRVKYQDSRIKDDYFAVFVYGRDIIKAWQGYNDKEHPFSANLLLKLNGRMNGEKNNLTLTLKEITWNYH